MFGWEEDIGYLIMGSYFFLDSWQLIEMYSPYMGNEKLLRCQTQNDMYFQQKWYNQSSQMQIGFTC